MSTMRVSRLFMLSLYPAFCARIRIGDVQDADSNQQTSGACSDGLYFQFEDGNGSDAEVAKNLISADWKDEGDQHYKYSEYIFLLSSSWYELKSKEGGWWFSHTITSKVLGNSFETLAACVSGCPPEWQRDEVYNTSWQVANKGVQFTALAGCNTAWRRFSQGAKAVSKMTRDIIKGAPEAFKKWRKDRDEQERYLWGDAPYNACKGGIQLKQKDGNEEPLLNALYVDSGRSSSDGPHEFKNRENSSSGLFNNRQVLLEMLDGQWNVVVVLGGLSRFDSGEQTIPVAACASGCPKPGNRTAWWLGGSHGTVWQVGDEESVNVEAKCCHEILGGPVICSPF